MKPTVPSTGNMANTTGDFCEDCGNRTRTDSSKPANNTVSHPGGKPSRSVDPTAQFAAQNRRRISLESFYRNRRSERMHHRTLRR